MPLVALVVWLLVAVGCRSVDVSDASDESGQPILASEVPETEPSDTLLTGAVTVTTVLPVFADDSGDGASESTDPADSTAVPDGTRWEPSVLPSCRDLIFPEGAVAELAEVSTRWDYDPLPVEFDGWSISAMHAPDPAWAASAVGAVTFAKRTDPRAYAHQYLFVTVTSKSGSERTHRLPLAPPWEVHSSLHTAANAGRIVAADDGWMIPVSVTTFMDSRLLVSEYFAEQAPGVVDAVPHEDDERQISGLRLSLTNWSGYDGTDYAGQCLASWSELGTTQELYDQYGKFVVYNKPYPNVRQESGYLWVSSWDGEPVRVELPDQWGVCCGIQVLDDGYLAFSDQVQFGYFAMAVDAPDVHYSRDGFEWRKVVLPTRKFTWDDGGTESPDTEWIDIPIWVCSIESTDSGVLIAEGQGGPTMCHTVRHWIADADLTNWRLHPDSPTDHG